MITLQKMYYEGGDIMEEYISFILTMIVGFILALSVVIVLKYFYKKGSRVLCGKHCANCPLQHEYHTSSKCKR